jgi:polar amino acid transport system substrate-binding protein
LTPVRCHIAVLLAAAALLIAACGKSGGETAATAHSPSATAASACAKRDLALKQAGRLTVATDDPAHPPYFLDGAPSNGKGFESAVAYAVAKQLGFAPSAVKWVVVPFNSSFAPRPKTFDFDINEISITPSRAKHVDFSIPYYTAQQAVVALKRSPVAGAASLAELKNAKLGVQIGTTSLDAIDARLEPASQPRVYNDSNDVVRALKGGQIDAVVVDVPTAFYLTSVQVPSARIVGQFSAPGGDSWGVLLERGSKLTPCVDRAIGKLKASGELQRIQARWMGASAGAVELR